MLYCSCLLKCTMHLAKNTMLIIEYYMWTHILWNIQQVKLKWNGKYNTISYSEKHACYHCCWWDSCWHVQRCCSSMCKIIFIRAISTNDRKHSQLLLLLTSELFVPQFSTPYCKKILSVDESTQVQNMMIWNSRHNFFAVTCIENLHFVVGAACVLMPTEVTGPKPLKGKNPHTPHINVTYYECINKA